MEPIDREKLSTFVFEDDKREFKKLCAEAAIPMCSRLEAWIKLDNAYLKEYGKVLNMEELNKTYFGNE